MIQNAPDEGLGHLEHPLRGHGARLELLHPHAGEHVPAAMPPGFDALLVLGGPASAYDPTSASWLADTMRLVRHAHLSGRPVLGVCLGAQLVAHALGGRARRGPAPEVGFVPLTWTSHAEADPVVGRLARDAPVFQLHHDTYALPGDAVRLASSAHYAEQAFRIGQTTYGVQFHVEFTPAQLGRLLRSEAEDLAAVGVSAEALLEEAALRDAQMAEASARLAEGFLSLARRE